MVDKNKKKLIQSWRWYGPSDTVSLQDIKQAGATHIVTALHHIPHGEVWPVSEIKERLDLIERSGLKWEVVESVPVHESIKTNGKDATLYLENYIETLKNLAACEIKTICYNFMPVLDWTRTQLDKEMTDGSKALYFDWIDLAIFDMFILSRPYAKDDYSSFIVEQAQFRYKSMHTEELEKLSNVILMGIPDEGDITIDDLKQSIERYKSIGFEGLKKNLILFLSAIAEVCEQNNIKMTIHPDDPPYPILGLPRIVSNLEDFQYIMQAIDKPFNGVCFCTGSLGAGNDNNLLEIFNVVRKRIYFAHLRNVKKDEVGNFYEADHLDGDVDMYSIMKALVEENSQRDMPIPFRPDHGHQMLDDLDKTSNPGYSAIGRLRGLAELRGLELGILSN